MGCGLSVLVGASHRRRPPHRPPAANSSAASRKPTSICAVWDMGTHLSAVSALLYTYTGGVVCWPHGARLVVGASPSPQTPTLRTQSLFTDHASQLHYCTAPAPAVRVRTVGECGDINQTHAARSRSHLCRMSLSIICIEMQLLPEWLGWLELEPKTAARFL